MNLETEETTQITKANNEWVQSAEWSPDGEYVVVSKGRRNHKLFMYHKDGGGGFQLIKNPSALKAVEPAFSADGRYIYYAQRRGAWNYNAQLPQYQIGVYDRGKRPKCHHYFTLWFRFYPYAFRLMANGWFTAPAMKMRRV